jgi:hypothetical protein
MKSSSVHLTLLSHTGWILREIVRMTIGAAAKDVRRLIVSESMIPLRPMVLYFNGATSCDRYGLWYWR